MSAPMSQRLDGMTHQRLFQFKAASSVFIAIFWLALIFLATISSVLAVQAADKPAWLTQAEWAFLQDHVTITIAPDPDFPPIESIDSDGNYTGLLRITFVWLKKCWE